MASRPVFRPGGPSKWVLDAAIEFEWFPGFAVSQKQRSIESLHSVARHELGIDKILEVSSKSPTELGAQLSAFKLRVPHPTDKQREISVEAAFQGSEVFSKSGQLESLYDLELGREIKARVRDHDEERLVHFQFGSERWHLTLTPPTLFYDWLYLQGIDSYFTDDSGAKDLFQRYEAFTDIEFNPKRSINCQARSCALYLALARSNQLDAVHNVREYRELLADRPSGDAQPGRRSRAAHGRGSRGHSPRD
jgi:hypothetical protein